MQTKTFVPEVRSERTQIGELYLTVTYVTAAYFPLYPDDVDELTLRANLEVRPEQGPDEKVVG